MGILNYIKANAQLLDGWVGPCEQLLESGEWLRDVLIRTGSHTATMASGEWVTRSDMARRIRLDLRIPQVRDRVARCLAVRVGLECGATAPSWEREPNGSHWTPEDAWCLYVRTEVEPILFASAPVLKHGIKPAPQRVAVVSGISEVIDPARALAMAWRALSAP